MSIYKKHELKKKTLTNGPNDATHVVWARFLHRSLSVASP